MLSSCSDIRAVAIAAAIQDYIAFPGVIVTLPNANQAVASLIMSKSALDTIRPLARNQFFVQTTASITYSGNLEMSEEVRGFARMLQSGRNYENAVGECFSLTDSAEASNNSHLMFKPIVAVSLQLSFLLRLAVFMSCLCSLSYKRFQAVIIHSRLAETYQKNSLSTSLGANKCERHIFLIYLNNKCTVSLQTYLTFHSNTFYRGSKSYNLCILLSRTSYSRNDKFVLFHSS